MTGLLLPSITVSVAKSVPQRLDNTTFNVDKVPPMMSALLRSTSCRRHPQ